MLVHVTAPIVVQWSILHLSVSLPFVFTAAPTSRPRVTAFETVLDGDEAFTICVTSRSEAARAHTLLSTLMSQGDQATTWPDVQARPLGHDSPDLSSMWLLRWSLVLVANAGGDVRPQVSGGGMLTDPRREARAGVCWW